MRALRSLVIVVFLIGIGCKENGAEGIDGLEVSATQCTDEEDNDGDGLTDCRDDDCQGYVFSPTQSDSDSLT